VTQIFHRSTNPIARTSVFGAAFIVALLFLVIAIVVRSPWATAVGVPVDQPVPFSHQHHVRDDLIDCRYCHTTVEESSFAGMPATSVCMNCHSLIWNQAPVLAPVRESLRTGVPIVWNRVYDLPDFVYFDHSIHVAKGVGCVSCHGRMDLMPLTWKAEPLTMEWCLACHRQPERYVRPREQVFAMAWQPPADRLDLGRRLVAEYGIAVKTSCSTCHR
jgi:hypothetical protein